MRIMDGYQAVTGPMTKIVWDKDTSYGLFVSRIITWPLGVWPLEEHVLFARIRTTYTIVGILFLSFVLALEVVVGSSSPEDNMDCIMVITNSLNGCVKVSSCWIHTENLFHIYSAAVDDYASIDSSRKRDVMRRHAFIARMMGCGMIFVAYICTLSFLYTVFAPKSSDSAGNISAIVEQFTRFPLPSTYISSLLTVTPVGYVLICIVEFMLLFTGCTANIGSDSFFLCTVLHLCGQIEVLKLDFSDCKFDTEKGQEVLRKLTSRHSQLVILTGYLAETMSIALAVQLFISCTTFCAVGLQCLLSLKTGAIFMFGKASMVLGTFLMQLFSYSYVGDYLKTQTEDIGACVYGTAWYSLPPSIVRNLVFIIMRTQQSVQLMAAQFIPMNMETYMSILKTSFSYLSVLRVMLDA